MPLNILLLDCSEEIKRRVEQAGFCVDSGSVGYCDGVQRLPGPIYDYEVIIYNPTRYGIDQVPVAVSALGDYPQPRISNATPIYELGVISTHIRRRVIMLAFVNLVVDDIGRLNEVYSWIPEMPRILQTHDQIVRANSAGYLDLIIYPEELKLPVRTKVMAQRYPGQQRTTWERSYPLLTNKNKEALGLLLTWEPSRSSAMLFVLPTYKSNDEICMRFLTRVVPKLFEGEAVKSPKEQFKSPAEMEEEGRLAEIASTQERLDQEREEVLARLAAARRHKVQQIDSDETAKWLFIHYERAVRETEDAYVHIYKLRETLKDKFGGEDEAIRAIGCKTAWEEIGRLTNAKEKDARHAPRAGEKLVQWSEGKVGDGSDF